MTDAARTTALELRQLGFTWVFAPVADVTIGAADPTIGSRSASSDPALAAEATAAAVEGYDAAGLVSTTKHFPGHGGATSDSHDVMPVLEATLEALEARDLRPFEAAVAAHAPAVMVSHLDVEALAPGTPASLAAAVYDYLRDDLGFEGVTITDSLGMGAVTGREKPAVTALQRGGGPAADAGRHPQHPRGGRPRRSRRARSPGSAPRRPPRGWSRCSSGSSAGRPPCPSRWTRRRRPSRPPPPLGGRRRA